MTADMYKVIKKQNGEAFAKAIRNYDTGIFDIHNIDKIVKYAGRDAEPIMNFLISLKDVEIIENENNDNYTDLLDKAGYDAYYADTFEKQNAIKPYFARGEELCTFRDGNRYKKYHIINCVKKNVNDIKREDFDKPNREDEYGTSVISIQILKSGGFISIKNRYNHSVMNPDNTFNSNPDKIIGGLSEALRKQFDTDFSSQEEYLPNNYAFINFRIVKHNYENENIYYGDNYYVKDGIITEITNDKIILDTLILDWKTNKITDFNYDEGFGAALEQEIAGKKLRLVTPKKGHKILYANDEKIIETQNSIVKSVHFREVTKIKDNFLYHNKEAESVILEKAMHIGDNFMHNNTELNYFVADNVKTIFNYCLYNNECIEKLSLPNLKYVKNSFLYANTKIKEFKADNLREVGNSFMFYNKALTVLSLPELYITGKYFLDQNKTIAEFNACNLVTADDDFMRKNEEILILDLPNLKEIGGAFLYRNKKLKKFTADKLEKVGYGFMEKNEDLIELILPSLKETRTSFLYGNNKLKRFIAVNLEKVDVKFLHNNTDLEYLFLPSAQKIPNDFLSYNKKLKNMYLGKYYSEHLIEDLKYNLSDYNGLILILNKHPKKIDLMKKSFRKSLAMQTLRYQSTQLERS